VKGRPILISQLKKVMRQIILEVEDSYFDKFMGMVDMCHGVKVVSTHDSVDTRNDRDSCVVYAINSLRNDGVFRYSFDYAWIMMAINEGVIEDFEGEMSLQGFIDYLKELGFNNLPCRTSLYNAYSKTLDSFPEWTFIDVKDAGEILRRKNVVKQFLSAYGVAKRGIFNNIFNK